MGEANLAAVLHGAMDLCMEQVTKPNPGPDDVLLAMGPVGICGSDIKYWQYGKCGRFSLDGTMVLGHEAAGTVAAVGSNVKSLQVGDRVAIEPGVPCRCCRLCKRGRYNLCPDMRFCATPPVDGNICQWYCHPADFCFKLPEHVSLEEGALLEPLAVAVYSLERAELPPAAHVLVCGAGPVGLLTLMAAKARGAAAVIITDIDEGRLALARELGADHVHRVTSRDPCDVSKSVESLLGCKPDATIECSGTDFSMRLGIYACKPGGAVILVGRGSMTPEVPIVQALLGEVDIKGVFRYANCYPAALSLVASGSVNAKRLVTHRFPLAETEQAFKTAADRDSRAVKVVINCAE